MTTVLVTGADGFIGRNLVTHLSEERPDVRVSRVTRSDTSESLREKLGEADLVYHLAGVNRPDRVEEFAEVNLGLTEEIVRDLVAQDRTPAIVFSSSTQAERDNEYGRSKRRAEEVLEGYAREDGGAAVIYRLENVFGKWARPDYNSVVATFCHRRARGEPIEIHDSEARVRLLHVDDVVDRFLDHVEETRPPGVERPEVTPVFEIRIGDLAERIESFRDGRETLRVPDMSDRLTRLLYSTYQSYLPEDGFAYDLTEREDERGRLAELLKGESFGQIFVSTTRPGVTRGHHYHHAKVEKFCVLRGRAVIRFRRLDGDEVLEYPVSGERFRVVDIPPGYTHSIENVGDGEMVVLFWANEVFDPKRPDTHSLRIGE